MSVLPDGDAFRRLVDGSRRGAAATLARAGLAALSVPYAAVVHVRNSGYDTGILPVRRAAVPVVSVGNLTLGGTGKTPLVAWLARRCLAAGRRPTIVSRGYGAAPGRTSDEAAELALVVPGVPHVADRDRVAAAAAATAGGAEAIVLDDGFQHRRLARDLDIVTIDCTDPFGCGRLFPRGLLREPAAGLRRAGALILTRCDHVHPGRRSEILAAASDHCRGRMPAVVAETVHGPVRLRTSAGAEIPLGMLRGRRVAAFCGIGNPGAFRRTLDGLGAEVVAFHPFADHRVYEHADAENLGAAAAAARADFVVATLKDLVKLPRETLGGIPLVALEIAIQFLAGEEDLDHLVGAILSRGMPDNRVGGGA